MAMHDGDSDGGGDDADVNEDDDYCTLLLMVSRVMSCL